MYAAFFGLRQQPFSIAPDPRYLFMSQRHREALAHLLYGLGGGGGFVLLSGEIGTGKTTVCRCFLEQIPPDCNVAYIFNPKLTATELVQSICDEFHVPLPLRNGQPPTVKDYLDPLNAFLLQEHAAGRNNVLIIDEAQNLSAEVLEQLRLLTNLETSERKLLQIVLIGQPQLRILLARPELEQLAQRVIARFHLDALSQAETTQYIQHRLEVAGLDGPLPFGRRSLRRVHKLARGVPRRINLLCDRALLGAFATGQAAVSTVVVDKAASEVFGSPATLRWTPRRAAVLLVAAVAAGAALSLIAARLSQHLPSTRLAVSPAPAARAVSAPAAAVAAPFAPAEPAPAAAQVVAVEPAPAPPPALLQDENQAWRELAQAWKATPGEGDACAALAREQLQCLRHNTSLALIRQLGRPGIVTLDSTTGTPSFALLTALSADSATLRAGSSEQTVTLPALAARWQGDFSTLWRSPPGYNGRIADGQGGPPVEWVAQQLAAVQGSTPPRRHPTLDTALKTSVRAFQVAQGLPADGRPGPLTFMQLNRVAGLDEPRLRTEP